MTTWMRRVRIGDLWANDDLTFEQQRDGIVTRLRALYPWAERCDLAYPMESTLRELLDDLASVANAVQFDEVWHEVYDWADTDHRVWIDLYSPPVATAVGAEGDAR